MHRFFAPALDPGDETVDLPRDEAEHLTRVLRLGVGDTVAVFDGRGHEFLARVVRRAAGATCACSCCRASNRPPSRPSPLTLVQAVLKGDKMDDVVRDAVMLGVAAIQPIVTRAHRDRRWRRCCAAPGSTAGAAWRSRRSKQSRRAVLPEIRTPLTFETLARRAAAGLRLMLVEPGARPSVEPLGAHAH